MVISGDVGGKPTSLAVISSGQHGFDLKEGEIRISVLRSPPYCYQNEYPLEKAHQLKHMDQGVHEMRILLLAADPSGLREAVPGLADWLSTPPFALAHLPVGDRTPATEELLSADPGGVRMIACKRSWNGSGLVVRLQEVLGEPGQTTIHLCRPAISVPLTFKSFEIKTLRFEKDGTWKEVSLIEEE
jgi:alpha-mannosidase